MSLKTAWKEVKPGIFESELGVVHQDTSRTRWFGVRRSPSMGQTGYRDSPELAMREMENWVEREQSAKRHVSR